MHHIYGNNTSTDIYVSAMTVRTSIFIKMYACPEFIHLCRMAMVTGNIRILILRRCSGQKENADQCQHYYPAHPIFYYVEIWFY